MRTPKIEVYRTSAWIKTVETPDGPEYRWRLVAANGRVIAQSSEGYRRLRDLTRSIEITWPGSEVKFSPWAAEGGGWELVSRSTVWSIIVPDGVSLHSRRRP